MKPAMSKPEQVTGVIAKEQLKSVIERVGQG
jgi:uncharacterized protein (UPF0335 family)